MLAIETIGTILFLAVLAYIIYLILRDREKARSHTGAPIIDPFGLRHKDGHATGLSPRYAHRHRYQYAPDSGISLPSSVRGRRVRYWLLVYSGDFAFNDQYVPIFFGEHVPTRKPFRRHR